MFKLMSKKIQIYAKNSLRGLMSSVNSLKVDVTKILSLCNVISDLRVISNILTKKIVNINENLHIVWYDRNEHRFGIIQRFKNRLFSCLHGTDQVRQCFCWFLEH